MKEHIVKLIVDHREVPSGIPTILEELGAEVEVKQLEIGDVLVSDRVVFERKTTSDFLHSVIDDRDHLFRQLHDMQREYERPILLIEGDPTELYIKRAIHPNAIDGMLLAVAEKFGIPILWTVGIDHTAQMLYRAATKEQIIRKKTPPSPHGKRSHMTMEKRRHYIVSSIGSGVGGAMAAALLKHFKTVERVMSAPIDDLCAVPGVGKTTAVKIREIVGDNFNNDECD